MPRASRGQCRGQCPTIAFSCSSAQTSRGLLVGKHGNIRKSGNSFHPRARDPSDRRKKKTQVGSDLVVPKPFVLHGSEEKPHVNVVAKPERKRNIPSRPEIANIMGKERAIEVFRGVYSKPSAKGDSECSVTGEIGKK
jgi:hypothetical protein